MSAHAIYSGRVSHARLNPFRHAFSYRVFSLLLDLDRLEEAPLAVNRWGLVSFREADHGAGGGPLKPWVNAQLAAGGLPQAARVRLLCFPRILGYVFNPLAIYFCHDDEDRLIAILHQVTNTFGERHSYLLPAGQSGCQKRFHVSPFFPVSGGYRFSLEPPGERLRVKIDYLGPEGEPLLVAVQEGKRQPLTRAALLKAWALNPLMSLKVTGGIHWEALKLWRRGAVFHRKPPPPPAPVSINPSMTPAE